MPGIMCHLVFATNVLENMNLKEILQNKQDFFAGNLIPDLTIDMRTKSKTHYYVPSEINNWFKIPNLEQARKTLKILEDPVKLGCFCHLYLDYHFIKEFLLEEFSFNNNTGIVENIQTGAKWKIENFWDALYNGYTEVNTKLISDGIISMEFINSIPSNLPDVQGEEFYNFNNRREITWKEELYGYLSKKLPYEGKTFNYDRLCKFVNNTAIKFLEEEI